MSDSGENMKSKKPVAANLPKIKSNQPYPLGKNPERDAWYTAFFIENHLDYFSHPEHASTPEQVRFMVYTDEDERYYPCSDQMFAAIINRNKSQFLQVHYRAVLLKMLELIRIQIKDKLERSYLESLIKIKHRHETRDEIMIPSRLEKRLVTIFLNRTLIEDPYLNEKAMRNQRAGEVLNCPAFQAAINHIDSSDLRPAPTTVTGIKELVEHITIKRLFALSVEKSLWESDAAQQLSRADYLNIFARKLTGNGVKPLLDFLGIHDKGSSSGSVQNKKILWLADEAGEVMVDMAIIKYLAKLGHKIIVAFKEGPLFTKVSIDDCRRDEALSRTLDGVLLITDENMGKTDLVKTLKGDYHVVAISDGTKETLNLMLASTTFARIFKEVDGIISRGSQQKRRLFDTHFQFTRDVFNISRGSNDSVEISYKPRHLEAVKFAHADLEKKARRIIEQMREAKKKGMTVIFYSGIIGSIPGKINIAKKIMAIGIQHLKTQMAMTFIINPSEYFEPGMDADDLMYMWEIVQTSGLIDIWRFQTYDDISQAFQIMGEKVPPEWVGKDATFSTGCTIEMNIALEVQKAHPEMQIIGPAKEKFMRRQEYGVGKMYDRKFGAIAVTH